MKLTKINSWNEINVWRGDVKSGFHCIHINETSLFFKLAISSMFKIKITEIHWCEINYAIQYLQKWIKLNET